MYYISTVDRFSNMPRATKLRIDYVRYTDNIYYAWRIFSWCQNKDDRYIKIEQMTMMISVSFKHMAI